MVAARGIQHTGTMQLGSDVKTIRYTTMLDYCDGPLLFEARDHIGGHYLAMTVETNAGQDAYAVVGVAPERLRQFRAGLVDLRFLLEEAGEHEWYLAMATDLGEPLNLNLQTHSLSHSGLLPEEGFVLPYIPTDAFVLKEAQARNNLMLELAVEPPEAAADHRVRVETYVSLLDQMQRMMKHAYRAVLKELPSNYRPPISPAEAALMDVVVPAAAGSMRVVLEAANPPDLLGGSQVALALRRVDMFFENAANPDSALETAKHHRGHLAGAYLRLLRFLEHQETGFSYSWAEPSSSQASSRAVSASEAGVLAKVLSRVTSLGTEEVTFVGEFMKVNRDTRVWGLDTGRGIETGKVIDNGPSLNGLTVGSRYKFFCVEEIEAIEGTGRETRCLYLRKFERE